MKQRLFAPLFLGFFAITSACRNSPSSGGELVVVDSGGHYSNCIAASVSLDDSPFMRLNVSQGRPGILLEMKNLTGKYLVFSPGLLEGNPNELWRISDARSQEVLGVNPYTRGDFDSPLLALSPYQIAQRSYLEWPYNYELDPNEKEFKPGIYELSLAKLPSNKIKFRVDSSGQFHKTGED